MTALIDTNHRYQSAHYKAARAGATNICTHRALVTGGKETKHYNITSFIHTIVLKELPRSLLGIWVAIQQKEFIFSPESIISLYNTHVTYFN